MKELIGLILEEKFVDDPFRYSSPISGWFLFLITPIWKYQKTTGFLKFSGK